MPPRKGLFFFSQSCPFSTSKQLVSSCQLKLADQPFMLLFSDSGKSAGCLHQSQNSSAHTHASAYTRTLFVRQCRQIHPDPDTQKERQMGQWLFFFITKWLEIMKLQRSVTYFYRHCPPVFLAKANKFFYISHITSATCRQ